VEIAKNGIVQAEKPWQYTTFIESLRVLLPAADELPGLKEGLTQLEEMVSS
jgi:hypothetical protein